MCLLCQTGSGCYLSIWHCVICSSQRVQCCSLSLSQKSVSHKHCFILSRGCRKPQHCTKKFNFKDLNQNFKSNNKYKVQILMGNHQENKIKPVMEGCQSRQCLREKILSYQTVTQKHSYCETKGQKHQLVLRNDGIITTLKEVWILFKRKAVSCILNSKNERKNNSNHKHSL